MYVWLNVGQVLSRCWGVLTCFVDSDIAEGTKEETRFLVSRLIM